MTGQRLIACFWILLAAWLPAGRMAGQESPAPADATTQLYQHFDDAFKIYLERAIGQMGKEVMRYENLLPGLLPKKVTVRGSHYSFGYLVGLVAREAGLPLPRRSPADAEINRQIEVMYAGIYPPQLEKARGIAAAYGAGLAEVDLRSLEHDFEARLWWDTFRFTDFNNLTGFSGAGLQCSVLSYYLENEQRHLTGRNFDNDADRPVFLTISGLDGVYRTIGHSTYQLHNWIVDGINERGLFAGVASVVSPAKYPGYKDPAVYPARPSIMVIHLLRIMLDTCASVDEALDLIGRVNVWFPVEVNHFLLADVSGVSVVVEFDRDKRKQVFRRQAPWHVMTNTALQEGTAYNYQNCTRFRTAADLLSAGITGPGGIARVLGAIQMHSGATRTLWSSIADLSKREFTAAYRGDGFTTFHSFDFTGPQLTWPQLALGGGYECTLLISNRSSSPWSGRISLKQGAGRPWSAAWHLNGKPGAADGVSGLPVPPGGTVKLKLAGGAEIRSGYLQIQGVESSTVEDLAVSYFYNYLAGGRLLDSVGSPATGPGRFFSFPAEKTETVSTAFAYVASGAQTPFDILFRLYGQDGEELESKTVVYDGQAAIFYDQFFDSVTNGHLGWIRVEAAQPVHFEVLRVELAGGGFQLTSIPPVRN